MCSNLWYTLVSRLQHNPYDSRVTTVLPAYPLQSFNQSSHRQVEAVDPIDGAPGRDACVRVSRIDEHAVPGREVEVASVQCEDASQDAARLANTDGLFTLTLRVPTAGLLTPAMQTPLWLRQRPVCLRSRKAAAA